MPFFFFLSLSQSDSFISVVARSNAILKQLVLQAKKEYEAEAIHRIQIYFADAHGSWRWTDSRHKRPMASIVLNPGVKEMLLDDARDFLKSEKVKCLSFPVFPSTITLTTFHLVVRRSWYSFPQRIPPSRCPRIRQIIPHPRPSRSTPIRHLCRIPLRFLDLR